MQKSSSCETRSKAISNGKKQSIKTRSDSKQQQQQPVNDTAMPASAIQSVVPSGSGMKAITETRLGKIQQLGQIIVQLLVTV